MIGEDTPCISCRYNLRGLSSDGHCPECHHPIQESLGDDRLLYSDRTWLARVSRGVSWMYAAGILFATALAAIVVLVASNTANLLHPRQLILGLPASTIYLAATFPLIGSVIPLIIGGYIATLPEFGAKQTARYWPTRAARLAVTVFLICVALALLGGLAPRAGALLVVFGVFIAAACLFAFLVAIIQSLQEILQRIPEKQLMRRCDTWLIWLTTAGVGVFVLPCMGYIVGALIAVILVLWAAIRFASLMRSIRRAIIRSIV